MVDSKKLSTSKKYDFSISYLIPIYNDEDVLKELHRRLITVAHELCDQYEIIFVEDGSQDKSWPILVELKRRNSHIKIIKLSRNFGQTNAISAGLDNAAGDVIVIMDSDLQDRPEDIHKLIDAMFNNDVNMAVARWISREDNFIKKSASRIFHLITNKITNVHYVPKLGMFRAVRRNIIDEVKKVQEKTSNPMSLIYWMGYDYAIVDLKRDARFAGTSGYTIGKMFQIAFDRIFSFSLTPIRFAGLIGLISGFSSLLLAFYYIYQKLVLKHVLPGWTSLIVIILFLFGLNFLFLGVIGEYLGRIFLETKNRPKYVIDKMHSDDNDGD